MSLDPSPRPATTTPLPASPPEPGRHPNPADTAGSSSVLLVDGPSACGDARHWATDELLHLGIRSEGVREDAELIVSELVSNAVQHGSPPIVVTLSHPRGALVVSVADAGGPPYEFDSPQPDPAASRGRGLAIVATLGASWGIRPRHPGPGKTVWGRLLDTGELR